MLPVFALRINPGTTGYTATWPHYSPVPTGECCVSVYYSIACPTPQAGPGTGIKRKGKDKLFKLVC